MMRNMVIAAAVAGLALAGAGGQASAAEREIAGFFGHYGGSALAKTEESDFLGFEARDLDIIIAAAEDGFVISWTTIKRRGPDKEPKRKSRTMFFLPGDEAAFEDNQLVPHGAIRKVWYQSSTLGVQRRMHIYTPPGYDASSTRFPFFYLLHGGGDEDSGWSTIGRAGFILDNLLAENKAVPMIVVMPNGSLPRPQSVPAGTATYAEYQQRFTRELMNDIVPFVESNFRTHTGRDNRALAGLSMGGGQTLQVVINQPDQFSYVGVWSAGLFNQDPEEYKRENEAFFGNPDTINEHVKLFSISVGDKDFALAGSENLAKLLEDSGIDAEIHISGGGHTWINWRAYLRDFAPLLFR